MKRMLVLVWILLGVLPLGAQQISTDQFSDAFNHWTKANGGSAYARYGADDYRAIADNIVAYQNEDGGWPKNLDMLARLDPDSVKGSLDKKHRISTLDNANGYTQVRYLAEVYTLVRDSVYLRSACRGMEYMLSTQYPNGGWRGWDADALTFNDGIMYGVLSLWLDVVYRKAPFEWIDEPLRQRIEVSWNAGLQAVLACQYVQNGTKTVWAQQYDHQTLQPVKARSYELPGLSAGESADIAMLLMRIRKPSAEVTAAVDAAAAWFEQTKITGKKVKTVSVPEGLPEDPKIKKDRIVVDDPDAAPMWARYYELADNEPFFCTRAGVKVSTLAEVPAERRVGYSWYGPWGNKVLKKYATWRESLDKKNRK